MVANTPGVKAARAIQKASRCGGNEVLRPASADEVFTPARNAMIGTLETPNMISVEASEQRQEVAFGAGVLRRRWTPPCRHKRRTPSRLCCASQMAGAHHTATKLLAGTSAPGLPPVEQARLTNASARMMQVYQEAFLTLQKIRTGGK